MSHHPSEETLIGYVAGSLPAPHRVVVRTHLAMCASCQVSLRLAHDLAGVMLEACAPAQMQECASSSRRTRSPSPTRAGMMPILAR